MKNKCDSCGYKAEIVPGGKICTLCHWLRYEATSNYLAYCTNLILDGQREIKERLEKIEKKIKNEKIIYTDMDRRAK